ncbi:MAG: tetratricopeptide (TPR) repeat protein, partial [Patescibacteria group bacterium]
RSIVHFYEEYESDIQLLTVEEYFEMSAAYIAALFEVGAYTSYLASCDDVIESVIYFNINKFEGENIYYKLLFRKAVALYHLMEYEQSEKILRELIRMNPKEEEVVSFFERCLRAQPPKAVCKARIVSVLFFVVTACVIATEIFIISKFFPEYSRQTELLRNGIFVTGWTILASSGLYLRYMTYRKTNQVVIRNKE